jgi:fructuronate reductase
VTDLDRSGLEPTVVHLGPGGFHRAHQAVYADTVLRTGSRSGAIWAVSLRSSALRDALAGQDYRYHVVERDDRGDPGSQRFQPRRVESLLGVSVAAEQIDQALVRLTDPAVQVVTITVTEHGYCAIGPGGGLDLERAEIRHDLSSPRAPRSLPGLLLETLVRRRAAGLPPVTIASCDNLPGNGTATRRVVCELAEQHDSALATWVAGTVAFPSSMVDRMVPASTDADQALLKARTGIVDAWPVLTEPFSQWVLEDTFPTGRPPWERAGVELVGDVTVFERAKLRILNAAHSALAYWGLLAGYRWIWQAAADPVLVGAVTEMLQTEVLPTLATPPGWDLSEYVRSVLDRFANRALPYTTAKVAADGSQKLPVRVLGTVADRLAAGAGAPRLALVVAAWVTAMFGPDSPRFRISDPALTGLLGDEPGPMPDPDAAVNRLLGRPQVFGSVPAGGVPPVADLDFWTAVRSGTRALWAGDVRTVLAAGARA